MRKHLIPFLALAAAGCDAGAPKPKATVTLTSVAFAEDCGGTPPVDAPKTPAAPTKTAAPAVAAAEPVASQERVADVAARRRCDQTSMQLTVVGEVATELHIKSVEVYDASGKLLGRLVASKPTRWNVDKASYEAWDETVVAGPMSVSYVLSQPTFVDQWDARDRTYTVKVIAALGDVDQKLKTSVLVVGRPPPVPT